MKHFIVGLFIGALLAFSIYHFLYPKQEMISTSLVQQDTTITEFVHTYQDTTDIYLTHTDTVTVRDSVDALEETFEFDDEYFSGSITTRSPASSGGLLGVPTLNINKAPLINRTVVLRNSIGVSTIVSNDFAAILGSYSYQHSRYEFTGYAGYSTVGMIGGVGVHVSF